MQRGQQARTLRTGREDQEEDKGKAGEASGEATTEPARERKKRRTGLGRKVNGSARMALKYSSFQNVLFVSGF